MFKPRQLVKSRISETVYLIIRDCEFFVVVMVLQSPRVDRVGNIISLKSLDGEIIGNNYKVKQKGLHHRFACSSVFFWGLSWLRPPLRSAYSRVGDLCSH